MAKSKTSIQINGIQYDAATGLALTSSKQPTVMAEQVSVPVATLPLPSHRRGAHAQTNRVQASQTLVRHAVKKPAGSLKKHAKAHTATHHASHVRAGNKIVVHPKTSLQAVNHARAHRAAQQSTHQRVSKFSHAVVVEAKQVVSAIDNAIVIPQTYSATAYRPDIRKIKIKTHDQPATSDIFEQALRLATSHEEPAVVQPATGGRLRSLRRRMVSFTAGAVAVLAIVGFFGFQHQEQVAFSVAANKTSFSATMPGYQPKGFELKTVTSTSDYLAAQFTNGQRNYSLVERQTSLSNDSLLEQLVVGESISSYAAVPVNGRTVYMYGKNQAAWIHKGVLYQVLGYGSLSSHDFKQIASSL